MQARDTSFLKFIGQEAQYFIPIYQRKYSWGIAECQRLYEDVIKVARDDQRPCHFIGSVIYLAKNNGIQHASAIQEYLVIDGQQRITTLALLLLALGYYFEKNADASSLQVRSPLSRNSLSEHYIVNSTENGDLYYKIKLNAEDFDSYKKIVRGGLSQDENDSVHIFENFNFFLRKMQDENVDPQEVFNGIKKLALIDTILAPADNPQLVFETVNSTGLALTTPDKIRNFLLMTVPPEEQTFLYNEYWHPMEHDLGLDTGLDQRFNTFFKYYMTVVTERRTPNDYYSIFKDYYYTKKREGTEAILKHIRRYSKHYLRWENASKESGGIDYYLYKIKSLGQHNITPAVLRVVDDVASHRISDSDAIKVFAVIESYWARRSLCSLPTNTAVPVCISILQSLGDSENYVDAVIEKIIFGLTWPQRMPTDAEMFTTMHTRPLYGDKFWERKLLDLLESRLSREYIHNDAFSIEHIMPQTIHETDDEKKDWISDLGEDWKRIHDTYLNTLGNLTLTGFNTEYSNYRFLVKRDMDEGYAHTPIRISAMLAHLDKWGEKEILERCDELTKIILDIWKYPTLQS